MFSNLQKAIDIDAASLGLGFGQTIQRLGTIRYNSTIKRIFWTFFRSSANDKPYGNRRDP
jgi:hypothetical protein